MNPLQIEAFTMQLEDVERMENFGYTFFFVGDDHRLPFVTIGYADNEFDYESRLNREGIFRLNIGISRQTYDSLVGDSSSEAVDYSALNVFMPHPHYAKQHFICILNPMGKNVHITKELILEAHSLAATRFQSRSKK